MKYPTKLPVFEYRGEHFEGRPGVCAAEGEPDYLILLDSTGFPFAAFGGTGDLSLDDVKPLTDSARKVVEWVRS